MIGWLSVVLTAVVMAPAAAAPSGVASMGGGTNKAAGKGDETAEETRDMGELTLGGARLGVVDTGGGGGAAIAACGNIPPGREKDKEKKK